MWQRKICLTRKQGIDACDFGVSSVVPRATPVPIPSTSIASATSVTNDVQRATVNSLLLQEAGLPNEASSDISQMQGAFRASMSPRQNSGDRPDAGGPSF